MLAALACGCAPTKAAGPHAAPARPITAPSGSAAAAAAAVASDAPATAPDPNGTSNAVDAAAALSAALRPEPADSVLLLGLHTEAVEGYQPMFSAEGKPRTDLAAGYRTLIIRTRGGSAEIVGEVPYLTVPQAKGFRFMGEASVSVHLEPSPSVRLENGDLKMRDYDATAIWDTTDAKAVRREAQKLERELKRKQAWGTENTTQIVYVTPRARCEVHTWSEVTGGALYFMGSSSYYLASVEGPALSSNLATLVDEPKLRTFAASLFGVPESELDLDRPHQESFDVFNLREDITGCIDHQQGSVALVGSAMFSANSARRFARSEVVMVAPETLAPGNRAVDFAAIRRAIPDTADAFVSPGRDVVLALRVKEKQPPELVVWDVVGRKETSTLPLAGRPIMAEWATGSSATTWGDALAPLATQSGRTSPR